MEDVYKRQREIDETANIRLEQMMSQLAKDVGATEALKASDPMAWVQKIRKFGFSVKSQL